MSRRKLVVMSRALDVDGPVILKVLRKAGSGPVSPPPSLLPPVIALSKSRVQPMLRHAHRGIANNPCLLCGSKSGVRALLTIKVRTNCDLRSLIAQRVQATRCRGPAGRLSLRGQDMAAECAPRRALPAQFSRRHDLAWHPQSRLNSVG